MINAIGLLKNHSTLPQGTFDEFERRRYLQIRLISFELIDGEYRYVHIYLYKLER